MKQDKLSGIDREGANLDELFRLFLESSLAGVYLIQDNLFRYVNRAFAEIFGWEVREIVDKLGPLELTAPEDRDLVLENVRKRVEGETSELRYSFRGLRKDGKRLHIEVLGSSVKYRNRPAIIGTLIDNTEKVAAGERYRRFFDEDIAAHYMTTPDGAILDCNGAFARLFGFSSKEEMLDVSAASLFPMPGGRDRFIELIRENGRIERHEAEYVRRDGKKIYVVENAVGEFDAAGSLVSIRGYLVDETNEKRLEGQLYQSQRLETLGTLVGGIAHDFNNILGVIVGHVGLMGDKQRSDPVRFSKSLEAVSKAANRGANIVRQLLTFARKVEIITESVRIGDIIEELVALLKETFPERIVFSVQADQGLSSIHADPNQLHQVLLNLCVNARDAMPGGGTITITASRVDRSILNGRFMEVEAEEYVSLKVSDTGTGMDRETLDHIFEPFFTTKKQGQGTGLGLPVVYGIMKGHHGFIDVESKVGRGTTFSLYFPIPTQIIEAPAAPSGEIEIVRGCGETILVVEDEEPLREFVMTVLGDNGYAVLPAADGAEALEVYRKHRDDVALILLDMGLPKMTGAEVLSELKKIISGVKVIAASGYLEPEIKAGIFEAGASDFLPKPYRVVELLGKITMALKVGGH